MKSQNPTCFANGEVFNAQSRSENCCDDCHAAAACAVSCDFEALWFEAENNANLNWICFPESADFFRVIARRLLDVAERCFCPEEFEDDDNAICLLMGMLDQPPRSLPCDADAEYQSLRRCLLRLNLISKSDAKNEK